MRRHHMTCFLEVHSAIAFIASFCRSFRQSPVPGQVLIGAVALMISNPLHADEVVLSCYFPSSMGDGNPRAVTVRFDDLNRSTIRVNGSRHPRREDRYESQVIVDDAKIQWCEFISRGAGLDPTHVCNTIDRITGEIALTYHRVGTSGRPRHGSCSVGANPAGRKF